MGISELADVVDAYQAVSTQLYDLHIEYGETLAAAIQRRADGFAEAAHQGQNVTACREAASAAAHRFDMDAVKLRGSIDAMLARRRWLDVKLAAIGVVVPPQHAESHHLGSLA